MSDTSAVALTRLPSSSLDRCQLTHIPRSPIDPERARAQHAGYRKLLAECGARVIALDPDEAHPDGIFVEDTAIALDEVAVILSMGTKARRGERPAIETELARHRPIERIDPPALIEGGDVLRIGRTLYVGRSSRTDDAGIEALRAIGSKYDYRVVPVPVEGCLHLKSGCTALDEETVLINPAWIDPGAFADLSILPVPGSEPWGACVLRLGGTVCISAAYPETGRLVRNRGYRVRAADISEFHTMEGGMTCLAIVL
jgi:dimethylargininase